MYEIVQMLHFICSAGVHMKGKTQMEKVVKQDDGKLTVRGVHVV